MKTYPEPISELHSGITNDVLQKLIEKFSFPPDAKILDVGCGQGPALEFLSKYGYKPVGIALNDEDVRICISKGYEVYKMDQSFSEFEDETFDFIWARHCVEHSLAPYLTLSEFYRVSKHNSYLYIEVPAPDTAAHHETNPNHYSVLTRSMWSSLILRTGFSIVDTLTFNLQLTIGHDEYWGFVCKCNKQKNTNEIPIRNSEKASNAVTTEIGTDSFDRYFENMKKLLAERNILPAFESIQLALAHYHDSNNKKYDVKYSDLLDIAGNLALANNKPKQAQKYFEEELNLNPTSSAACTGLGKVFFTQGKNEYAKVMFEWGVKNNPFNKDAVEFLSKVNTLLGFDENHSSLVRE